MASTFRQTNIPDPPANLPPVVADYLRQLVFAVRSLESEVQRAFADAEPLARLQVLGAEPARSSDGDEGEFEAGVVGANAGKYVKRGGSWVYLG